MWAYHYIEYASRVFVIFLKASRTYKTIMMLVNTQKHSLYKKFNNILIKDDKGLTPPRYMNYTASLAIYIPFLSTCRAKAYGTSAKPPPAPSLSSFRALCVRASSTQRLFLRSSEKSWKLRPIKWTCSCFRVWFQSNLH